MSGDFGVFFPIFGCSFVELWHGGLDYCSSNFEVKIAEINEDKKIRAEVIEKDAFTRFSVSYFSKVIESLSPERREIIQKAGFGSLLSFDKCFVPNKFVQWVARQIDYKTGDIVVKPSIIPFTRESVDYVLGLPLGTVPFPKDYSAGKNYILSSDEDVLVCFILVSLNCFLCPNIPIIPSCNYLGIFEDVSNLKKFDWTQSILDCLLKGVRIYNSSKNKLKQDSVALSGCLFLIAVYYLDFKSMIKDYAELDQLSPV
ncbi:hypothetical protein ACP4OV_030186 [Aristida adscensionis]